jgi:acetoin utilization deacetylase AcuC-like enzyme
LLTLLQSAYREFGQLRGGLRPAIPDSFAVRELAGYRPRSIWGRLGHHCTDSLTPILEGTWEAAYAAAQLSLSAAAAVDGGAPLAYALCRPPGHHAYHDLYGGYCYLNNAAIAAQWLVERGHRPAILDIDYHHGNGTQAIFYDRADVFFCSLHADPEDEYPYYCGFAAERGVAGGEGYTLNLPLPLDTAEITYLHALQHGLEAVAGFAPDVVLLALGFDTLLGDPQGEMKLEVGSFRRIGRELAGLGCPLLLIQEGGYCLSALGPALTALLEGLLT